MVEQRFCKPSIGVRFSGGAPMHITHLIPTYNEAENVVLLIPSLQKLYSKNPKNEFTTVFVDDSNDNTPKIINAFQKKDKSIKLITGPHRGLGAAVIFGYKYTLKNFKPDIVVTNEADFAYDHAKIPLMVKLIEQGFDVVVASRHVPGGTTMGWTWSRHLNHWAANTLFADWIARGNYVSDHNGAFRAIRVKGVLDQIKWKGFPTGFAFFNYLLFKLHQINPQFYEFPTVYSFRARGESKVSFNLKYLTSYLKNVGEYIWVCLKIRRLSS